MIRWISIGGVVAETVQVIIVWYCKDKKEDISIRSVWPIFETLSPPTTNKFSLSSGAAPRYQVLLLYKRLRNDSKVRNLFS